ncbi:MAG: hypothetical protein RIT45_3155 [Pseudomonadota bacterium]
MATQPKPIFLATDVELQTLPDGAAVIHWAPRETWSAGNGARFYTVYYQVLQNSDATNNTVRVRLQGSADGKSWVNMDDLPLEFDDIDNATNLEATTYWPSELLRAAPFLRWGLEIENGAGSLGTARATVVVVPWWTDMDILRTVLAQNQALETATGTTYELANSSLNLLGFTSGALHVQTSGVTGGSTTFSLLASMDDPDDPAAVWVPVPSSPTLVLDATTTAGALLFSTQAGMSFRVAYVNTVTLTGTPVVDWVRVLARRVGG